MTIDCDNGYERGTDVTCTEACAGQCCAIESGDRFARACAGFTGLVYRDGSCTGNGACKDSTIAEVKGPSCVGLIACTRLESSLIEESCNGKAACVNSEISLIKGSCNSSSRSNDCNLIILLLLLMENMILHKIHKITNIIEINKFIIVIRNDESNSFLWNRMELLYILITAICRIYLLLMCISMFVSISYVTILLQGYGTLLLHVVRIVQCLY